MREDQTDDRADFEGPLDLPDDFDPEEDGPEYGPSLTDDLAALFEDGKTYAEAEVAFQKSRAAYAANRLKSAVVFGLGAFGVFHLALIALTVGVVIALVPLVGPWAATAIVSISLVAIGAFLLSRLKGKIDDIRAAFSDGDHD